MVSTRGGVALLVQARDRFPSSVKLLAPHVATRIWAHAYGSFEYPEENPSVGCTSHPRVRSVSLIDPGLTLFFSQKKKKVSFSIERICYIYLKRTKINKRRACTFFFYQHRRACTQLYFLPSFVVKRLHTYAVCVS